MLSGLKTKVYVHARLAERNGNKSFESVTKFKRSGKYKNCIASEFNPLRRELHPSAQRCLPRFFTGDFNF
jgi:hypothetical protein